MRFTERRTSNMGKYGVEIPVPLCQKYPSPFDPVFLSEPGVSLRDSRNLFLRDGSRGIQELFREHPFPSKTRGRILVHESARLSVPRSWKERVSFYRLEPLRPRSGKAPKRLLLCAPLSPRILPLPVLDRLLTRVPDGFTSADVMISLLIERRNRGLDDAYFSEAILRIQKTLRRRGCGKPKIIEYSELIRKRSLVGQGFIELTDPSLCADSFLTQLCLARGAQPLAHRRKGSPRMRSEFYPLSENHGVRIL